MAANSELQNDNSTTRCRRSWLWLKRRFKPRRGSECAEWGDVGEELKGVNVDDASLHWLRSMVMIDLGLIVVFLDVKVGEAPYFIIVLPSVKSTSQIPTRSP